MADFTTINQEIDNNIKQNGVNAITGQKLNTVLKDMMSAVNTEKQDTIDDLAEIRTGSEAGAAAYQMPEEGIPSRDLSEGVQKSLENADNAVLYEEQSTKTDQQRNIALANVSNQTANSTTGKMGYKVLDGSKSFASQVTAENTIYEIRDVFDLGNTTEESPTIIPSGSILKFNGGCIKNGVLVGNATKVSLQNNVFDNVELQGTFSTETDTISTSIFKTWNPYNLLNVVLLCNECGTVILEKEFTYTCSKRIVISKSITIDGCGKTLTTINSSNNRTLGLFDISDCEFFTLKNITIDGGITVTYDSSNYPVVSNFGTAENTYFIITKRVKNVTLDSCKFQNIYASNLSNYKDPHYYGPGFAIVVDYEQANVLNCDISHENNIFTGEGFQFRPKTGLSLTYQSNEYDEHQAFNAWFYDVADDYGIVITEQQIKEGINDHSFPNNVIIENSTIDFTNTSSAIEIRFGKAIISNNVFGTTTGSVMNTFVYDSEIKNNVFDNVHRSGAIDLNEQGMFGYVPKNVRISGNTFGYCREGLLMTTVGENISFVENKADGTDFNTDRLDYFDSRWQVYERVMMWGFYISGGSINIENNEIKGYKSLFSDMYYTYTTQSNEKELNLSICSNNLEQLTDSTSVHIGLRRSGTTKIIGNTITNAAKVYYQMYYWRLFILFYHLKYFKSTNIQITDNNFIESRNDFDCVGFGTNYDATANSMVNLSSFVFTNNVFNQTAHIAIATQNPNLTPTQNDNKQFVVRNNKLCGGNVFGFVNFDTDEPGVFADRDILATTVVHPLLNSSSWNGYSYGYIIKKGDIYPINTSASVRNSNTFQNAQYTGVYCPVALLSNRNYSLSRGRFYRKDNKIYYCVTSGTTAASDTGIDYDSNDFITDGTAVVFCVGEHDNSIMLFGTLLKRVNQAFTIYDGNVLLEDKVYKPGDFAYNVVHVYGKADLNGETVTMVENSTLIVHENSNISNGTIVGNNTRLELYRPVSCSFSGTFRNVVFSELKSSIHSSYKGQSVFDLPNNRIAIWNGTSWVDPFGKTVDSHSGDTTTRTVLQLNASADIGYTFFDTTLGKMVVWNGTAWVNLDGTALS